MATILSPVYQYSRKFTREWQVPAGTAKGTAIVSVSNQPAVTLTPRGDSTATTSLGGAYTITYNNGAVGQRSDSATVATDGTWAGPVTGADSTTAEGTLVYYVPTDGSLSLTATGNVPFGIVDAYPGKASATDTAIRIGVFA